MIQTVKGISVVNEVEVDFFFFFFLKLSCFFYDPVDVGNLISGSTAFSKSRLTSCSSWFMHFWSLAWRILSITVLVCEMSAILWQLEHSLALPLLEIRTKPDFFQSCGHCRIFQIVWHIECSTLTASSFRIWKSSTGIPSPPLALFTVMLPKSYLTSQSKISVSRWVITPSWLSGSWRSFLFFCVFLHLFLISFAFVRSIPFLSFIVLIFAWNIPFVSLNFLKRSLVFPILLSSFISFHWSLRKAFLSLLAILGTLIQMGICFLFSFAFCSLLFTAICRACQATILPFCISFSGGWSWSLPLVQCHELPSIVLQALYQIESVKSICHVHCIIVRDLT